MEEGFIRALGPISWPLAAVLAITSGVAEELLFRAAVQSSLGLIHASLLFAMVHIPHDRDMWIWPLLTFMVGLGFGVVVLATGHLAGAIAAHALVNFVNLGMMGRSAAIGANR